MRWEGNYGQRDRLYRRKQVTRQTEDLCEGEVEATEGGRKRNDSFCVGPASIAWRYRFITLVICDSRRFRDCRRCLGRCPRRLARARWHCSTPEQGPRGRHRRLLAPSSRRSQKAASGWLSTTIARMVVTSSAAPHGRRGFRGASLRRQSDAARVVHTLRTLHSYSQSSDAVVWARGGTRTKSRPRCRPEPSQCSCVAGEEVEL